MSSSAQLSKNVSQALEKQKTKLNDVMKNAKNNLKRSEVVAALSDDQIKALAICEIRSFDGLQAKLVSSHDYVGSFLTRVPEFVTATDGATFVHQGSKGAIVYASNPEDVHSRAWLLAWSKPEDSTQLSKVYVSSGTVEAFTSRPVELWNGIRVMLDQASDFAQDYDPITGAVITAKIVNSTDIAASVGATISIMHVN